MLALLLISAVSCRYDNLNNGLAVIRDKVTPEEISEVIINPRKRDLSSLSSVQNQIEAANIQSIINEQQREKTTKHEREIRAVKKITTRLQKSAEEEAEFSPDHFIKKIRLVRAAHVHPIQTQRSSHPGIPNVLAVPAKPPSKFTNAAADVKPKLLRISYAK